MSVFLSALSVPILILYQTCTPCKTSDSFMLNSLFLSHYLVPSLFSMECDCYRSHIFRKVYFYLTTHQDLLLIVIFLFCIAKGQKTQKTVSISSRFKFLKMFETLCSPCWPGCFDNHYKVVSDIY